MMSDEISRDRRLQTLLRKKLSAFIAKAFATINPGTVFHHNWHYEAIAWHLEQVARGKIKRLIITMPPRTLKSLTTSIAFPAWLLGHDPTRKVVCVTYGTDLTKDQHNAFRKVVTAPWYRSLFPKMAIVKDNEFETRTSRHGGRYATTVGGPLTGRGGNIIVIDDPMKAEDAHSDAGRETVLRWYRNTLLSRLNDKMNDSIIVLMQRLHVDDLVGYIKRTSGEDWVHLDLPAIAPEAMDIPVGEGLFHHREPGDVLNPDHEPLAVLENLKREMSDDVFSAQYQQQPVPPGGLIFKRHWITEKRPAWADRPGEIIISIDTANKATERSDYSAITVWAAKRNEPNMHLLEVIRARLEYPELLEKVIDLRFEWSYATILIEDAGSGIGLLADLRYRDIEVEAIKPEGDKTFRAMAQTVPFKTGLITIEPGKPWVGEFINELMQFPNGRFDDQVDSAVQAVGWWREHLMDYNEWRTIEM